MIDREPTREDESRPELVFIPHDMLGDYLEQPGLAKLLVGRVLPVKLETIEIVRLADNESGDRTLLVAACIRQDLIREILIDSGDELALKRWDRSRRHEEDNLYISGDAGQFYDGITGDKLDECRVIHRKLQAIIDGHHSYPPAS